MANPLLPEQADVVVVGGGIMGCATAYFLAKAGARPVVLEKGDIADEQSGRNWGWIRQQGRTPRELPLAMLSVQLWKQLAQELDEDIEFVQAGSLRLAYTEEEMHRHQAWNAEAGELGLDTRVLSRREVQGLFPALDGPFLGGSYTPGDAHAEPRTATKAVARAAQRLGATVYPHCAVEGFEVAGGRTTGVITERGVVKTDTVVCAAGAWSSRLGRMLGLHLPQRSVRATVANTTPLPTLTHTLLWGQGVALRQKRDGTLNIAGGGRADYDVTLESFRQLWLFLPAYRQVRRDLKVNVGLDLLRDLLRSLPWSSARRHPFAHTVGVEPRPNLKTVARTRRNLLKLLPSLGEVRIQRAWAGMIDAAPDGVPVLGEVPGLQGFLFATGGSGHGFVLGPAIGLTLAGLILGRDPPVDIKPLRFSRFRQKDLADRSKTI